MVSKAVGVSSVKDDLCVYKHRPLAYVSKRTLSKETTEAPWGVTNSLKRVGLLRRTHLPAPMSSMASTSAVSKVTKGSIWSRLEATKTALKFSAPHLYSKKGWKMATEHATWFACINMPNQTLEADHTQDKLITCNKADQPSLWRLACCYTQTAEPADLIWHTQIQEQ